MAAPRAARPLVRALPGLGVAGALAAASYGVAASVPNGVLSPLAIAMALGIVAGAASLGGRAAAGLLAPGTAVAAGPLLKLGVVALGARLDVRSLLELGPALLVGSVVGAVVAFAAVELVGRTLRVEPGVRTLVAIGTAICGASAIAAAAPVCRARPEQATLGIATVSLVGTAGVLAFAAWGAVAEVPPATLGVLAGATLQEVGQVVAAGAVGGAEGADRALLVKLSRVILLGPALVALALVVRRTARPRADGGTRPPLPGFVLGFLAVGALVSTGAVPSAAAHAVAAGGTALTAVAMAALGLRVDLAAVRRTGSGALLLGTAGAAALTAAMAGYYRFVVP